MKNLERIEARIEAVKNRISRCTSERRHDLYMEDLNDLRRERNLYA